MSDPSPINPYASPAVADAQLPLGSQGRPLYSPTAVSVATFFGSIAAGALVMAINYARSGRSKACWWTLGLGFGGAAALIVGSMFLPDEIPSIVLVAAQTVLAHMLATRLQQSLIREHLARGGQLASAWWAFGMALLVSVALVAIFLLVAMALPVEWMTDE